MTKLIFYTFPGPNTVKVAAMLEECGLAHEARLTNPAAGDTRSPEFLKINPAGQVPFVHDPDGPGGVPIGLGESGAILIYLAEKCDCLLPADGPDRYEVLQWVMWQVSNVGPVFPRLNGIDKVDAATRDDHLARIRGVLDALEARLTGRDWLAGDDYSIADLSVWPWYAGAVRFMGLGRYLDLSGDTATAAWVNRCMSRPATQATMAAQEKLAAQMGGTP